MTHTSAGLVLLMALVRSSPAAAAQPLHGQAPAQLSGTVFDTATGRPIPGATIQIDGTTLRGSTDQDGRYRLRAVASGQQVLRISAIGYAPLVRTVQVPSSGALVVDVFMARSALKLPGITVTAEPAGRARGELSTASVIEGEAIRHQTAASLSGVLELIPGVVLQPPGLDGVQQFALRAVPVSTGSQGAGAVQPSAGALASFGTQIVLDGVPLSNNANLQSLGSRGELSLPSAAGGGIDLRRLPATTIDRVEVIRGIPSARFGDLTQGAILVDTRAGTIDPEVLVRLDPRSVEATIVGGAGLSATHEGSVTLDLARTRVAPGQTEDESYRIAAQAAHRLATGRLRLDTRLDGFQLVEDRPETPAFPGIQSRSRDRGIRLSQRGRLELGEITRLEWTAGFEALRQRSLTRSNLLRGAEPFTDRLTEGRQVGRFVAGAYNARVDLVGDPRHLYGRVELMRDRAGIGGTAVTHAGIELRREWNGGAGYQFAIDRPPQASFNGVNGYDRPRRFDDAPPLVTTGLYATHRGWWPLGSASGVAVQGGLRLDLLQDGSSWLSGARDAALQPRLSVELVPRTGLRLRAGAGRLAKVPALSALAPGLQYYDLVNLNHFANDPAERLAVLTTRIIDRTNPDLGYIVSDRLEAAVEADIGAGAFLSLVAFRDRTTSAVGILAEPTFFEREHFRVVDSTAGLGRPPDIEEPAFAVDSVPVLIDRPANTLTFTSRGAELVASLPEIPGTRTRLSVLGSWSTSRAENRDIELGNGFGNFQLSSQAARTPYWAGSTRTGERFLVTTRLIHHQPGAGLMVTGTVQLYLEDRIQNLGGTDTLAFAGYVTRAGELVPVPVERRGDPEFADLRQARTGLITDAQESPDDWLFSLQVAKSLPAGGRLAFYAFNAFGRVGTYAAATVAPRLFSSARFGLEVTMPVAVWR